MLLDSSDGMWVLPGWPASFERPQLFLDRIERALKWPDLTGKERPDKPWLNGKQRHIFWCDLSDPWTESLPVDWLAPYLPILADSPHIHIFCTKRPARARQLFELHAAPANLVLLTTVTSAANRPVGAFGPRRTSETTRPSIILTIRSQRAASQAMNQSPGASSSARSSVPARRPTPTTWSTAPAALSARRTASRSARSAGARLGGAAHGR